MRKKLQTRLVHEGEYVAEVDIELIYADEGWSPYLSLEDAQKLDDVREELRTGKLKAGGLHSMHESYSLTPIVLWSTGLTSTGLQFSDGIRQP